MISSQCGELSENPESYLLKILNKIKISRKKILYFILLFIIISFILRMEIECVFHYRKIMRPCPLGPCPDGRTDFEYTDPKPERFNCRIKYSK